MFAESIFDDVSSIYGETELQLKNENPSTFAGFEIEWTTQQKIGITAITTEFPLADMKYQSVGSFVSESMKTQSFMASFTKEILKCWTRQWRAIVVAGYMKHLVVAIRKVVKLNKGLGDFLNKVSSRIGISPFIT